MFTEKQPLSCEKKHQPVTYSKFIDALRNEFKAITGHFPQKSNSPEDYLRELKDYYENIIAFMPHHIYWLDKNSILRGCNNEVAELCGLPREKCIGLTYDQIAKLMHLTEGQAESFKRDDLEVMHTGKAKINVEEPPLPGEDGEPVSYYISSRAPLKNHDGDIIGIVGMSINITDRKKAERLQREKEIAEKTTHFMEMLAGSIAHELRTPFAIISVTSDLLRQDYSKILSNRIKQSERKTILDKRLGVIKHVIASASHIINNILTTLRTLVSGTPHKNAYHSQSMKSCIDYVLLNYPFLDNEPALVKADTSKNFTYLGDSVLTQHIFFNLIKNAIQVIKEEGKGEITIELKKGKDFNSVIFTDTAKGIPAEYISRIFDQYETSKSIKKGTGLGLAFCKMVMTSYGGNIICKSKEGKFTKFILTFPKV